jgi:hypothetical protein
MVLILELSSCWNDFLESLKPSIEVVEMPCLFEAPQNIEVLWSFVHSLLQICTET